MKTIIIFFTFVIGGIIYFHHALQNGDVLHFIDTHPQSDGIPTAAYYIGQGYYLFQNLPEATTYFIRVAQRYPNHSLADDSYFSYVQCLDDMGSSNRADLIEAYKGYLEKFPKGQHAEIVKNRIDTYGSGGR